MTHISQAQQIRQMPTPEQRAKGLQKVLKLTDEQTAKIASVYQQMDKERANDKATQGKLQELSAAHNTKAIDDYMLKRIDMNEAKINPILTADQKKTCHMIADKARNAIKQREAKG